MVNAYKPPFCTSLATLTGAGAAINATFKTQAVATILEIRQLFSGAVVPSAHPDFNKIPPSTAYLIDQELLALANAINAHA